MKVKDCGIVLLLTAGALLVHGYHPGVEDAEIYLPGVEKILHPELFPFNAQFFNSHAHLTLFPNLIVALVRLTHLSLSAVLLGCEFGSIFLLLLACWKLSGHLFTRPSARWSGVALVAALLTLPVAGTALYIIDQYTNPRNLVACTAVFAVSAVLQRKYIAAALWLIAGATMHPFMAVFSLAYCVLLGAIERYEPFFRTLRIRSVYFGTLVGAVSPAYHEAARSHSFHYVLKWTWYEWLGILGPALLIWYFGSLARSKKMPDLERVCRALILYEILFFVVALVLSIPQRFESLARIQPLRSLHLFYILLFLFAGGFIGQYLLKNRWWRWAALFAPLCLGMFAAQRQLFPGSAHVEWPGVAPRNNWAQAFLWVSRNTPTNAVFALDPYYMSIVGEDNIGFRAVAMRSRLADVVKDSGAVIMFPPLAEEWQEQLAAQKNWRSFSVQDYQRLKASYGVDWIVLQRTRLSTGLDCPYQNDSVAVCHI